MVLGLILCFFWRPAVWLALVLLVPMIADGFIQLRTPYESTNPRRFFTGLLFGYGMTALVVMSLIATTRLGYRFGSRLK